MDFVKASITAVKLETEANISESIMDASKKYNLIVKGVDGGPVDQAASLRLLKKPFVKGQAYSPGIILRKGLYKNMNNPSDDLWIGMIVTPEKFKKLPEVFDQMVTGIVSENPAFGVQFIMPLPYFGDTGYKAIKNVNNWALEFLAYNHELVKIAGKDMKIINIQISKEDNIDHVLELIKAMDTKLTL